MAKIEVEGLDDYVSKLIEMSKESSRILEEVVYVGADVIADAIKAELKTLPIDNGIGNEKNKLRGITSKQKADLIESMGIARIEHDPDSVNTKIGWDGYGSTPTKKYPKGVPNQMLMRSVESGTSFRQKIPVVRRAVNKVKEKANAEMAKKFDEELKKLAKE